MVGKAAKAVTLASEKMRQLNLEVFERGLKIEKLGQELAAAGVEVEQTRDRANKLEERFTQVKNDHSQTSFSAARKAIVWMNRNSCLLSY